MKACFETLPLFEFSLASATNACNNYQLSYVTAHLTPLCNWTPIFAGLNSTVTPEQCDLSVQSCSDSLANCMYWNRSSPTLGLKQHTGVTVSPGIWEYYVVFKREQRYIA